MAKFSCIRKALSFLNGGNAPFIGLLFLIGELKQVNPSNESCTFWALREDLIVNAFASRSSSLVPFIACGLPF